MVFEYQTESTESLVMVQDVTCLVVARNLKVERKPNTLYPIHASVFSRCHRAPRAATEPYTTIIITYFQMLSASMVLLGHPQSRHMVMEDEKKSSTTL